MIISHKYKFIFIRVRKTASSSMQVALSNFCGPMDIISKLDGMEEKVSGVKSKNNWCYITSRKPVFYNHIPAFRIKEMIAHMNPNIWYNYFKFCFERNLWDKAISSFWWNRPESKVTEREKLNKFIMHPTFPRFSDWRLYTDEKQNEVIVDKVFKYEEMDDSFRYLEKQLNLPEKIIMPKKRYKGLARQDHNHYREVLTKEERKRINQVFNKEIKEFGYEY